MTAFVGCSKSKPDGATGSASTTTKTTASDAAVAIDAGGAIDAAAEGSGAGSAAGSASGSASGSAAAAGGFDFDKLSHEEQVKFMKAKVMPSMKAAFQKFDPKEYRNFGCKTCHGKEPQKTKYKMPNKELKPLDFAAIKAGKEDPKFIEFMSKTVKPEMAKILNQPEMSESNPDGFGCLECHTQKKK